MAEADIRLLGLVTHHKCGTVWMQQVVAGLKRLLGYPIVGVWSDKQRANIPKSGPAFLVNWNGWLPSDLWTRKDFAVLHLIRDPRDVLLSKCQYHHVAPKKGEAFLHTPREDLGGKTYQAHLCDIESYEDKLLFEMREKHAVTVAELLQFPKDHEVAYELRYETLINDTEQDEMRSAFQHWNLDAKATKDALAVVWQTSLFGSFKTFEDRPQQVRSHVFSGAARRWQNELPQAVGKIYAQEFGNALIELGYETDTTWVDRLPVDPVPFNLPDPMDDPSAIHDAADAQLSR